MLKVSGCLPIDIYYPENIFDIITNYFLWQHSLNYYIFNSKDIAFGKIDMVMCQILCAACLILTSLGIL